MLHDVPALNGAVRIQGDRIFPVGAKSRIFVKRERRGAWLRQQGQTHAQGAGAFQSLVMAQRFDGQIHALEQRLGRGAARFRLSCQLAREGNVALYFCVAIEPQSHGRAAQGDHERNADGRNNAATGRELSL